VTDCSRDRVLFSGKHRGRRKEGEDRRKYIEGEDRRKYIEGDFDRVNRIRFRGGKYGKWGKNIGVEAAGR
jgi:hypothetical protein